MHSHFDIVHVGDMRFPGGTSSAIAHEVRALAGAGYSVALVQKAAATLKQARPVNPRIQAEIDAGRATVVTEGTVEARLAVIHNPYVLETIEHGLPVIRAGVRILVAHQPVTDRNGAPYYDADRVAANAERLLGGPVVWAPISPLSRANLVGAAPRHPPLDCDWTNIVFVDDWKPRTPRPRGERPVVGRHSRPDWVKWPADLATMVQIYPDDPGYDVQLLGAGAGLAALLRGARQPDNWTIWAFNEIDVADFLRSLDIFAYYHHPDWVEGFGRTIAEAMAAGLPVILPEHFRATFGEAALYRAPANVRATIDELWADPEAMALQARIGQKWIDRHYGPAPYLARIEALIGAPCGSGERRAMTGVADTVAEAPVARPAAPAAVSVFDVVHVGDFRTLRETALRVAHEARIEAAAGYVTGLMHIGSHTNRDLPWINPEVDAVVCDGAATAIDAAAPQASTRLLLVHQPDLVLDALEVGETISAPRLKADAVVVVHDRGMKAEAIRRKHALFCAVWGRALWAPTNAARRASLGAAGVPTTDVDWTVSVHTTPMKPARPSGRALPVIGRIARCCEGDWPAELRDLALAYPDDGAACVRMYGWPKLNKLPSGPAPEHWEVFRIEESALSRFIGGLDAIVHFAAGADAPVHAYAAAMAHGVPVIGSGALRETLLGCSKAMSAREAGAFVRAMAVNPQPQIALGMEQARAARAAFGPQIHIRRLKSMVGAPSGEAPAAPARIGDARRRMLFVSSNGVGLGHLARLLAIARRMPADVEPAFLTMSQALPIVRQCGYPAEYLPFHAYAGCRPADWNPWFAEQLRQVIDFHRAGTVIFDAAQPYQGLLDAVAARSGIDLVWIRRGMWRETQNNDAAIRRQRFFDLIVEPTDIAESSDRGATAHHRAFARKVAPIRFLEDHEILSREEACSRIGLDPSRPSCLIQLGSGSNRDIVTMIDTVLDKVRAQPGMQPVIAEWMISPNPLDFWPGVKRLRGFPLSRYFNAFDFTVSAAGYNSFNEIISFGLPAVFMANDHATMDDQGGRARFAQDNDAAFQLPDNRPEAIGPLVERLLDPGMRALMAANCRRISRGNGAQDAADAIAAL